MTNGQTVAALELADWRRSVAELYAEVRRVWAADPHAAHAHWRGERERLYRSHPQSPVPLDQRQAFRGLSFRYDHALHFELPLLATNTEERTGRPEHSEQTDSVQLPTSTGSHMAFYPIGQVEVPFPAGGRRLTVLWLRDYAGGLFLPFGDATNGRETYAGGRYLLDTGKGADLGGDCERGTLILDFNFAYQPSCAFDPRWTCPLVPPENRLDLAILAGERRT